jgi:hypothetical protein
MSASRFAVMVRGFAAAVPWPTSFHFTTKADRYRSLDSAGE